ncbi:MAG TPA: hypothetical protein DCL81_12415, partial [Algoriphagus sp.]|nr:hypothetical protein [Algoriphagus sp.]
PVFYPRLLPYAEPHSMGCMSVRTSIPVDKKMSLHAHISPFTSKNLPLVLGKNLGLSVGSIFLISLDITGLYVADKQINNRFIDPFLSHFKTLQP